MDFNEIIGEKVIHQTFGNGIVKSFDEGKEKEGSHINVKIDFNGEIKELRLDTMIRLNVITFENKDIKLTEADAFTPKVPELSPAQILELKNKKKLLDIWHEYGFEGFLHTTELENFESIIHDHFLIPRSTLVRENHLFVDRADENIIKTTLECVKECCRFYYNFKTPTNYNAGYEHPVIMVFDENLIDSENRFFAPYNAARHDTTLEKSYDKALNFQWKGIFERGIIPDDCCDKKTIIGMRNAEFLIHGRVRTSCITKVYFKNQEDLNAARMFCPPEMYDKFFLDENKFCKREREFC